MRFEIQTHGFIRGFVSVALNYERNLKTSKNLQLRYKYEGLNPLLMDVKNLADRINYQLVILFFYPDSRVQAAYQEAETTNTELYDVLLLFHPHVKPVTEQHRS